MESLILRSFTRLRLSTSNFINLRNLSKRYTAIAPRSLSINVKHYSSFASQTETLDNTELLIKDISHGDEEIENKMRVLLLEIDVMRHDGMKAPLHSTIKRSHWDHLLSLQSRSARYKYLGYLWKNEKSDENKKAKKEAKRVERLAHLAEIKTAPEDPDPPIDYSLSGNSMFLRIYESSMNRFYNHKLMQTMLFGQKLILDCSYDKYMTVRESQNAAKQLTLLFAENRFHLNPANLYLCNCNHENVMMRTLKKNIPTMFDNDFPLNIHTENYLDLFPKEKLVYLTPHCRNDLVYDPDDIYIIGCMVDKANSDPLSVAKAKENKIRMARLPLDRYLQWNEGSGKSLTINQVCKIILDINHTGDWNEALKHVPRRKLANYYENYHNNSQMYDENTEQVNELPRKRSYVKSPGYTPYIKNDFQNKFDNFDTNQSSNFKKNFYEKNDYRNKSLDDNGNQNYIPKNNFYKSNRTGDDGSKFYNKNRKTNNKFSVQSLYDDDGER